MKRCRLPAAACRCLLLVGLFAGPAVCPAIEPARAFLDALRERELFDVALDYLESAAKNPAVPISFKETLAYEKGVTLIQGAKLQRDTAIREKQLDEGQQALSQFVNAQPTHLLAIATRIEMGKVIIERASIRVERAQKLSPAEKQKLHQEAHALYTEASKVFGGLVEELKTKLKSYSAAIDETKEPKKVLERDRYRQDQIQAQMLAAATREEMAETLIKDSKEWTETLTAALNGYKSAYEEYRTRLAGLHARIYQARCLQKLDRHKEASAILNELLKNPDTPDAFHALKVKTMSLAVDSWLAQNLPLEILRKREQGQLPGPLELVAAARPAEERSDEINAIRVAIAKAAKMYADELKRSKPNDPQIKLLLGDGRKHLAEVVKFPNPYQDEARKLLPEFAGGSVEAVAGRKEPKTFAEARTLAREAINDMQAGELLLGSLPALIAQAKSPERAELERRLADAEAQAQRGHADAMHYCKLALPLVREDTDIDEVNLIRYLICYLSFTEGNYFDAVVIGDFLARRYPGSQHARSCAKIAMSGYLKLYAENSTDDKSVETSCLVEISDYIVKTWPNQPEAAEALNTLIPFMIRSRQLAQAEDYLSRIPQDSPHRGNAELKTGQALWASYIDNSRQVRDWESDSQPRPEGLDLAARKAELEALKSKAKQILVDGVERMQGTGDVNAVLVSAVLSLSQIYVDTNEAAKAVALLEDPKIGVLTLLQNDDPLLQREGFPEETYKTALRAYISSLSAGGADANATIEKARGVMDALKQRIGQTPQGQARLVAIYISLARDLQQQMEIADPAAKKALGLGFENFLRQVGEDATELDILNWVAETYRGMGESYLTGQKGASAEAKAYLRKAADTYVKLLDLGQKSPGFLTPAMTTQLRIQLAKTKKSLGDYIAARDTYESVLKANAMLLPVQVEAAHLYQDWGAAGKEHAPNYLKAMFGDRPDPRGKNVIWGWREIARMTASNRQFREQFFESRYNLALCRYSYAQTITDAAKKKETLTASRRDITGLIELYPDLGEKWGPQFDTLLKTIQKTLGEPATGLSGLRSAPAAPPANTTTSAAATK